VREDFELVTTIEHLEAQKDAFVAFFGLGVTSPSPRTTANANASERDDAAAQKAAPEVGQTEAGDALAHVHRIDYAKEGVSEAEMARMRRAYADTNDADAQLYRLARALGGDAKVDANADAKRDSEEGARAAAASTAKRRSKNNKFALGLEESPEVTALKAQIAALQAKLDAALRAKVVDQALVATLRAALDEARASRDAAVEAEAEAASAAIHELEVELERAEADLVLAKKAKAAGDAAVEAVQKAIDAGAAPEGEGEEKLEEAKRVREEAEAAVADAEAMVEDLERRIAALKTPNGAT
jgi:colicin import membrane protein